MAKKSPPQGLSEPTIQPSVGVAWIDEQIEKGAQLLQRPFTSEELSTWRTKTEHVLAEAFGAGHGIVSDVVRAGDPPMRIMVAGHTPNEAKVAAERTSALKQKIAMLREARDLLAKRSQVEETPAVAAPKSPIVQIVALLRRFPAATKPLRKRRKGCEAFEIHNEYDVQDLVHMLLRSRFDDVVPEETTPSFGGSSTRIDFLIPEEEIVVEIKMTREGLANKELTKQLADDTEHYKVHPKAKTLICFVYDPEGHVENPVGFERQLASETPLKRLIVVEPKT